jgi:hypothetical protein
MASRLLAGPSLGASHLPFNSSLSSFCSALFRGYQNLLAGLLHTVMSTKDAKSLQILKVEMSRICESLTVSKRSNLRSTLRKNMAFPGAICSVAEQAIKQEHPPYVDFVLGMGTQIMQQLFGINVTSYYLPTVFITSVGLSNGLASLLAACTLSPIFSSA